MSTSEFKIGRLVVDAEDARILRAAQRGALTQNEHGRWVITDESKRPARRKRERLVSHGYVYRPSRGFPAGLTSAGRELLLAIDRLGGGNDAQ